MDKQCFAKLFYQANNLVFLDTPCLSAYFLVFNEARFQRSQRRAIPEKKAFRKGCVPPRCQLWTELLHMNTPFSETRFLKETVFWDLSCSNILLLKKASQLQGDELFNNTVSEQARCWGTGFREACSPGTPLLEKLASQYDRFPRT